MLLLPIGRENGALQRPALVTYTIVLLNVLVFLFCSLSTNDPDEAELIHHWQETATYLRERPYLTVSPRIAHLMPKDVRERVPQHDASVPDWRAAKEQEDADAMALELSKMYDAAPASFRNAYIPAVGGIGAILTSMFLHAGLMHLIGNMAFLIATGPFVEDAFGALLYGALYMLGGMFATSAFGMRFPSAIIPLVGASGAIAAVMGAYLVRYVTARVEMLFIPVIVFPFWRYRFSVPAFVLLPLWFLEQIVSIPTESSDGGVAVTAHIAGFLFGAVAAGVLRVFLRGGAPSAKQSAAAEAMDPAVERIRSQINPGDYDSALRAVNELLAREPSNQHAVRLGLDIARSSHRDAEADAYAARLLTLYAGKGLGKETAKLIDELANQPLPRFAIRAAQEMEHQARRADAIRLYEAAVAAQSTDAVQTLVKIGILRRSEGDADGARAAFQRALEHPQCTSEWTQRINAIRSR